MKCIIIEDEQPAAERLQLLLQKFDPVIESVAVLEGIAASVKWIKQHDAPDFILLDIHLADGSGFDIFKQTEINIPVIFTTAYDRYALDAFKVMSVDYLLKPVSFEDLEKAVNKIKILRRTPAEPTADYKELVKLLQRTNPVYKTRVVGKVGQKLFFIETKDISFFTADNKIVILSAKDGNRYLTDHTLEQLETLLDPSVFFRINRSFIVNITAVEQVKPYINNRLKVMLKNGTASEEIIVSRERVTDFRKWADN